MLAYSRAPPSVHVANSFLDQVFASTSLPMQLFPHCSELNSVYAPVYAFSSQANKVLPINFTFADSSFASYLQQLSLELQTSNDFSSSQQSGVLNAAETGFAARCLGFAGCRYSPDTYSCEPEADYSDGLDLFRLLLVVTVGVIALKELLKMICLCVFATRNEIPHGAIWVVRSSVLYPCCAGFDVFALARLQPHSTRAYVWGAVIEFLADGLCEHLPALLLGLFFVIFVPARSVGLFELAALAVWALALLWRLARCLGAGGSLAGCRLCQTKEPAKSLYHLHGSVNSPHALLQAVIADCQAAVITLYPIVALPLTLVASHFYPRQVVITPEALAALERRAPLRLDLPDAVKSSDSGPPPLEARASAAVRVTGALGPNEKVINGVFEPSTLLHNGHPLFYKCDSAHIWLRYTKQGEWSVCNTQDKDFNPNKCQGYAFSEDSAALPDDCKRWRVDAGGDLFEPQASMRMTRAEVAVHISGVAGPSERTVNGVFEPTGGLYNGAHQNIIHTFIVIIIIFVRPRFISQT
jgi:hypothetical protein